MGIPSYFRKILQKYPGCLSKTAPKAEGLYFDFNCLVYRCIRAPGMPPVPSDPQDVDTWERDLLKEVRRTVKEVWKVAGQPRQVLLAVDGVVPMAKIRQQRVRRFKSAWLRQQTGGTEAAWDSNAITPGTAFMEKLTRELEDLAKEQGRGWVVSGIQEPGEGEHKIMKLLRTSKKPAIIYGLDADLILLSMLVGEETRAPLWLLREKQEFGGKMITDADGEQEYTFMNLDEFKGRLGVRGEQEAINYVALMSLMGNDFLPHSLTHKLNDDGHDCVMKEFRTMCQRKSWLVANDTLQLPVLLEICKRWASDEEGRMAHMVSKKREQAERGVGKGMDESEGLPLEWRVEDCLVDGAGRMKEEWREEYWKWIHPCANKDVQKEICDAYIYGCQWILKYYRGSEVNRAWMFPAWIPPLWSDLVTWLETNTTIPSVKVEDVHIQPQEQLAMVLPLDSWGLVRDRGLRRLPVVAPQMWPTKFEFFSLGRKWLWECEARVPVLTAVRLREILKEAS
jgi:5'-3' exonuclease